MTRKRTIEPGGSRGTLFEHVARTRLEDAAVLLEQERLSGAIYLAGYAIECLLKWAVTRYQQVIYLPAELGTHNWRKLLSESGLQRKLTADAAVEVSFNRLAASWGPDLRYLARPLKAEVAKELYHALLAVYNWVQQNTV